MDAVVADQFGPERFVTGQLAQLDLSSGVLHLLSAGHPRPLLLRDGRLVREIECTTQLPIGLGDVEVVTAEVPLQPGDRVLFYTDGVVEARSTSGEEFGVERLGDLAARAVTSGESSAEIVRRLIHDVQSHEAGNLRDDATLVLVGWPGG
jgi:serine phosphatase RsbU (regulator of sigma subunit)